MPSLRIHAARPSRKKVSFCCPCCGTNLLMDSNIVVASGNCPACGGWISSPEKQLPMPALPAAPKTLSKPSEEKSHRFAAKVTPWNPPAKKDGPSSSLADLRMVSGHRKRKPMRDFYRSLTIIGGGVCMCLVIIFWRLH